MPLAQLIKSLAGRFAKQIYFGDTIMANPEMCRSTVALAERFDYDSIWVGDHVEFPVPILDPLLQIAQAAGMSDKLTFGTGVYLLPSARPPM